MQKLNVSNLLLVSLSNVPYWCKSVGMSTVYVSLCVKMFVNETPAPKSLCLYWHHPDAASLPPYPCCGPAVSTQRRWDQNNASVTASILCPGALWKRATFSCRAFWRCFWIASVQSPACLQSKAQCPHHVCFFSKPPGDLGLNQKGMSFLPNIWRLMICGLWVDWIFLSCVAVVLLTSSLILLICKFNPLYFQQLPTSSLVCCTVEYYGERVDIGCETTVLYHYRYPRSVYVMMTDATKLGSWQQASVLWLDWWTT